MNNGQENSKREEEANLPVAASTDRNPADAGVVEQAEGKHPTHGECCDDCRRTCKRNFWTSFLNAIIKVATIILAGFGLQSFNE